MAFWQRAAACNMIDSLIRLTQASLGEGGSTWPGARQLLLLKLWSTVFPASDRRHPVLTPAALLVGAHLALCPVMRHADIPQGALSRPVSEICPAPSHDMCYEVPDMALLFEGAGG